MSNSDSGQAATASAPASPSPPPPPHHQRTGSEQWNSLPEDLFCCVQCRQLLPSDRLLFPILHVPVAQPLDAFNRIVLAFTTISSDESTSFYQFPDVPIYCNSSGELDCYCLDCIQGRSTVTVRPPPPPHECASQPGTGWGLYDQQQPQGQQWPQRMPLFSGSPNEVMSRFSAACEASWRRKYIYDVKQGRYGIVPKLDAAAFIAMEHTDKFWLCGFAMCGAITPSRMWYTCRATQVSRCPHCAGEYLPFREDHVTRPWIRTLAGVTIDSMPSSGTRVIVSLIKWRHTLSRNGLDSIKGEVLNCAAFDATHHDLMNCSYHVTVRECAPAAASQIEEINRSRLKNQLRFHQEEARATIPSIFIDYQDWRYEITAPDMLRILTSHSEHIPMRVDRNP